jgi:hypothetical protein
VAADFDVVWKSPVRSIVRVGLLSTVPFHRSAGVSQRVWSCQIAERHGAEPFFLAPGADVRGILGAAVLGNWSGLHTTVMQSTLKPETQVLKLRLSSHVVAIACSLGRKPKENGRKEPLAVKRRKQIHNGQIAVAASRLMGHWFSIPWAYAQGYTLPSLRDYHIAQVQRAQARTCEPHSLTRRVMIASSQTRQRNNNYERN